MTESGPQDCYARMTKEAVMKLVSERNCELTHGGVFDKVVIILLNGTEHLENRQQLCKPSLQCPISIGCISLDRAQQALRASTHTDETRGLVLALRPEIALRELPPSCLHI